jgi:hypothetical protein
MQINIDCHIVRHIHSERLNILHGMFLFYDVLPDSEYIAQHGQYLYVNTKKPQNLPANEISRAAISFR